MKYTPVHADLSSSTLFWTRKIKLRIFDDIYLYTFSKNNFFVAARMTFIFVIRCAGNKALFSFGLNYVISVFCSFEVSRNTSLFSTKLNCDWWRQIVIMISSRKTSLAFFAYLCRITRATNHIIMKKIARYPVSTKNPSIIYQCVKICFKLQNPYRTKVLTSFFSVKCRPNLTRILFKRSFGHFWI